jgi:hypothetical protein
MSKKWFPKKAEKVTLKGSTRFDECLLEVMFYVLEQVLGETAAKFIVEYMIFKSLQEETRISFGEDAKTFSNALQGILGAGCMPIEKLIVEHLCTRLGVKFEEKTGHTFSDYIKELKKKSESTT